MAQVHLYLAAQRLNVSDGNWSQLVAAMQAKGANSHPQPSHRCHWRPSLDSTIWIFEAEFDSTGIDVDWFVAWMASEFGVDPDAIGESTGYNTYGRFSTFSYGGQNRIRIGVFGFIQGEGWPSWQESHEAVLAYLGDNAGEWEPA